MAQLAQQDSRIQGIVPWAPLERGEGARPALAKLVENKLVKGSRRIIQFESDLAFCLRPDFVKGVQLLAAFDSSWITSGSRSSAKSGKSLFRYELDQLDQVWYR